MPTEPPAKRGFRELLGLKDDPRREEAFRASLDRWESNLFVAFERSRLLVDSAGEPLSERDLESGAPKLGLIQLYEQMGEDLFFWPPFWHRLMGMVSLARNPHYTSDPRSYRKNLREMFPDRAEAFIESIVETNTAESARERSDRDRREAGSFFKILISRASVRKRTSEFLRYLREDYLKVPPDKRSAWLARKAEETGRPLLTLDRYVRPSLPKRTKTKRP